jgi:hypothetical protein
MATLDNVWINSDLFEVYVAEHKLDLEGEGRLIHQVALDCKSGDFTKEQLEQKYPFLMVNQPPATETA